MGCGGDAVTYSPVTNRFYSAGEGICGFDCTSDMPVVFVPDYFMLDKMCLNSRLNKLYCLDYEDARVCAIDLSTDEVCANIGLGMDLFGLSGACVDEGCDRLCLATGRDTVLVYDCVGDTLVSRTSLRGSMDEPELCDAFRVGRVLAAEAHEAAFIDCRSDSVVAEMQLPGYCERLIPDPEGRWIYGVMSGSLVRFDPVACSIVSQVSVGAVDGGICVATDLHKIYCADYGDCQLVVTTLAADSIMREVLLPGRPNGICYDSADRRIYAACDPDSSVWIVDCTTDSVVGCIPGAATPGTDQLTYYPGGNWVYAARGGHLNVISCLLNRVVDRLSGPDMSLQMVVPCESAKAICSSCEGDWRVAIFNADRPAPDWVEASAVGPATSQATIANTALRLPGSSEAVLYDINGRRVGTLQPGSNDVSRLSPGVYFLTRTGQRTTKVVITR
jgi:DNA-binding beta-propeller fold protein YncE